MTLDELMKTVTGVTKHNVEYRVVGKDEVPVGTIVKLSQDDDSTYPYFEIISFPSGKSEYESWSVGEEVCLYVTGLEIIKNSETVEGWSYVVLKELREKAFSAVDEYNTYLEAKPKDEFEKLSIM